MLDVINDDSRKLLDRLECVTVLGQVIDSDSETESYRFDETYPLRFHLRQLSRYIWYDLLNEGKRYKDVLHAANVVKRQFAAYLCAPEDGAEPEEEPERQPLYCREASDKLRVDHWDVQQRMRLSQKTDAKAPMSPLGRWCINTDPTI